MTEDADTATQEPTDAEAAGAEMKEFVDAADEMVETAGNPPEIPTIVVHYLGFTFNRAKLPTGHFPTKAALLEATDAAILNKGWNIGSATLDPAMLPEIGCHREKAKAIAAATRAAKAAAPCKLQILDSNGEETESRTFRQKTEADSSG